MPKWITKFMSSATLKGISMPFTSSLMGRYSLTNALQNKDYLREYKNWVFACVQARSEEVGNIELKLLKNGEEIDDHPLIDLLNKVNVGMTRHDLFLSTQAFKDLEGNAFWFLSRKGDGKGEIVEIYPLRPDRVQIIQDKDNPLQVSGYLYKQPDGQNIPFMPQEILHHKTFNPLGNHPFPHRGMGIVEGAAWAVDTDNEARKWNYNFFKNSARPDGLLTTAGDAAMSAEDTKRLREEWNTQHGGSDNAHKIAVLSGGLTWTEIARSQKDMDFISQRTFSRDEILALFRVPKTIIGITDDVNRANADASIYVFALRTIKPLMQQMVDTLNEFLVPEFGDDLELTFESPVAEDRKQSLDEYAAGLVQGWLSINEVREQEGLEEVPNGDNLYMPLNMVPVANTEEDIEEEPTDPAPKPVDQSADDQPTKGKKQKQNSKKSAAATAVERLIESRKAKTHLPKPKKKGLQALSKEAVDKYIELWKRNIGINAEPLRKSLTKFFKKQEKEVLHNARQQMKFYTGKQIIEKGLTDYLFDNENAMQASVSLISPYLREYINQSGNNASSLLGSEFDPNTDTLQNFIDSRAQYFAQTINDTTREDLLTSIKDGLDNGEDLSQIETRIAGVYDIATGSRTQMIARTEISAASNQGAKSAYVQAGVDKWQWIVVSPEDEDCKGNEGVTVKIGDAFPDGDVEPPVHPNCECTTIPILGELE